MSFALKIFIILQGFFLSSFQYKFFEGNYLCTSYGCNNNNNSQSPIAIDDGEVIEIGMPALKFEGYNTLMKGLIMRNTVDAVAFYFEIRESAVPVISGGLLNNDYKMHSFHFHWGERVDDAGEHIINDEKFPLELHLVHINKKYVNLDEAFSYEDGLVVIAVLFKTNDVRYPALDVVVKNLPEIWISNTSIVLNEYLRLNSLLPTNIENFYMYKGSLPSAPFFEVATWIVFSETVPISLEQLEEFRKLEDENGYLILSNYRNPQEINNRRVYYRNSNFRHFIVKGFIPKTIWYK